MSPQRFHRSCCAFSLCFSLGMWTTAPIRPIPTESERELSQASSGIPESSPTEESHPNATGESDSSQNASETMDENQPADPRVSSSASSWHHDVSLSLRFNPIGLSLYSSHRYCIPLWDSEHLLLEETHTDFGISGELSPTSFWGGPQIEVVPIAFFAAGASLRFLGYFGNFGHIQPLESMDADWSEQTLEALMESRSGRAAIGYYLNLYSTLQAELAGFVAQVQVCHGWFGLSLDDPYYEPYLDLLLAPRDRIWSVDAIGGYSIGEDERQHRLLLAARYLLSHSVQGELLVDRVGPLVAWYPPANWLGWGNPIIAGQVEYYLRHPYRHDSLGFGMLLGMAF